MFIFAAGLTFNMWEYFPQNALLMLLWGMVLGCRAKAGAMVQPLAARADYYPRLP
jgi:hypothetical protein